MVFMAMKKIFGPERGEVREACNVLIEKFIIL